jgi:hypothetical protein
VIKDAKDDIRDSASMAIVSYATFSPLAFVMTMGFGGSGAGSVDVYKHTEKYGMTVEVISATEGQGIYKYLDDKNFSISKGIVPQLDSYVEKGYSFVVTWRSGWSSTIQPGVIVDFPMDRIYYPLRLTSIYGKATIPTSIYVMRYVAPRIFNEISAYTKVTYYKTHYNGDYYNYYSHISPELSNFTIGITKNAGGKFTKIEINAPSNSFIDDPFKPGYAEWIHNVLGDNMICCGVTPVLFFFMSLISGLITGFILFGREDKENRIKCMTYGIANILGLLPFAFVMLIISVMNRDTLDGKMGTYIATFMITFLGILLSAFAFLVIPLM